MPKTLVQRLRPFTQKQYQKRGTQPYFYCLLGFYARVPKAPAQKTSGTGSAVPCLYFIFGAKNSRTKGMVPCLFHFLLGFRHVCAQVCAKTVVPKAWYPVYSAYFWLDFHMRAPKSAVCAKIVVPKARYPVYFIYFCWLSACARAQVCAKKRLHQRDSRTLALLA